MAHRLDLGDGFWPESESRALARQALTGGEHRNREATAGGVRFQHAHCDRHGRGHRRPDRDRWHHGVSGLGWNATGLQTFRIGHVNLPALVLVCGAASSTAPLTARFAHNLSAKTLKMAFAMFLIVVGISMLSAPSGF
ncbi:MAG: hypothetical protein ACTHP8_21100 [Bosea sp. (in: a-proteobacteria)]|uniref:hypothetical protein n=1 Tax=Bosea sp. (in: a-proteobacteria) TaxID=1871050 RepID=UPI003F7BF879